MRQTGDRGPDHSRAVEDHRVHRDRVGQIFAPDHLDHERLPPRHVERAHKSIERGEHDHVFDFDDAGPGQSREHERADHQQRLRADYQAAAIDVIDHHAGEQCDQHDRHEARKRDDAEHQRRIRKLQHQPRLRDHLHPGADQRDQLSDEEEPEIAMPQRAERGQPSAPIVLRRNVAAGLVNFSSFYFRNSIDFLSPT